ncbi:MAG TPA: hypothetical protein VFK31_00330 [Rhodanobacteraceae bacterium]|jgi:hypothetical protein|nr:hypothetical protein [Rhodanobacteraceae bacterium]
MLRTSEQVEATKPAQDRADAALDEIERRRNGARRTAWIIGAIAAAFFVAALLEGHFSQIPILH